MRAETVAPLVDLLRGLAQVQARLPTLHDLAELLDLSPSRTRALLAEARRRGMIVVHRGKNGVDWAAVEAADGSWRVERDPRSMPVATRKCLRCRTEFAPEHRHNFLCRPCGYYADREG
jgi:hypothetical protein